MVDSPPLRLDTIHPDIRFTRLGAHLIQHAGEDSEVGKLIREILSQPHDKPLEAGLFLPLGDAVQEADHPLESEFTWSRLPQSLDLDRSLAKTNRTTVHRGSDASVQEVDRSVARLRTKGNRERRHERMEPEDRDAYVNRLHDQLSTEPQPDTAAERYAMSEYAAQYAKASNPKRTGSSPRVVKKGDFTGGKTHPLLEGTRLGYHLAEIRNSYGSKDAWLRMLADAALKGTFSTDAAPNVFSAIKERLLQHAGGPLPVGVRADADTPTTDASRRRASDLVKAYNWDRVGHGLKVDKAVSDFVRAAVNNEAIRSSAHRAFVNKYKLSRFDPTTSPEKIHTPAHLHHLAMWDALRKHVLATAGDYAGIHKVPSHLLTDVAIERSLKRLAEHEAQREDVLGTKTGYVAPKELSPRGTEYHWQDHLSWLPTSTSTGAATPEQYTRDYADALRYGFGKKVVEGVKGFFEALHDAPSASGGLADMVSDVVKGVASLPGKAVAAAGKGIGKGLKEGAKALGAEFNDYTPPSPDLPDENGRKVYTIDPNTGNEPGVNMWSGQSIPMPESEIPVVGNVIQEHHPYGGIVHDTVIPGSHVVAPTASAAWHERSGVANALEKHLGRPVSERDVAEHVALIRKLDLAGYRDDGFGEAMDNYKKQVAVLPQVTGKEAGSIRGTSPGARASGPVVDRLAHIVTPLVRAAHAVALRQRSGPPRPLDLTHPHYHDELLPEPLDLANDHYHDMVDLGSPELRPHYEHLFEPDDVPVPGPHPHGDFKIPDGDFDVSGIDVGESPHVSEVEADRPPTKSELRKQVEAAAEKRKGGADPVTVNPELAKLIRALQSKATRTKNAKNKPPVEETTLDNDELKKAKKKTTKKPAKSDRPTSEFLALDPDAEREIEETTAKAKRKQKKTKPADDAPLNFNRNRDLFGDLFEPLRYVRDAAEVYHHTNLTDSPHDREAAASYADWLRGQGNKTQADIIETHAHTQKDGTALGIDGDITDPFPAAEVVRHRDTASGKFQSYVVLNHLSAADNKTVLAWTIKTHDPATLLRQLRKEGVHVAATSPVERHGRGYRAPAKGMVDDFGLFQKGGRFVGDLDRSTPTNTPDFKTHFIDTRPKRLHPRMSKILRSLKAKVTRAADLVQG